MFILFGILSWASIILLIIGYFSPETSLFWYKSERTRKKSALIYGGCFLLTWILAGVFAPEQAHKVSGNSSENNSPSAENSEKTEQIAQIGDNVQVGNFAYQVDEIRFMKAVGNEFAKQEADGIYLLVGLSILNTSKESRTLDNALFKLTDESGTQYETSTNGISAYEMSGGKSLFLKQCQPNITTSGVLVFEVPKQGVYDLHLSGGFWSGKTAVVKLKGNK